MGDEIRLWKGRAHRRYEDLLRSSESHSLLRFDDEVIDIFPLQQKGIQLTAK